MNKRWPHKSRKHASKEPKQRTIPNLGLEPIEFYRKEGKMSKFWQLLKESVIIQGVVTVAFVGTACYLYATGQEVPSTLIQLAGVAVGYFFGAKQQQITGR